MVDMALCRNMQLNELIEIHGLIGFLKEQMKSIVCLVPGTFLKKALKGELPLLQKAQELQEELMMLSPEEIQVIEPLAQEKYLVKNAKKIGLLACWLSSTKIWQNT